MAIRCEWMSVSMVIMQKRDGGALMRLWGVRTGLVIGQQIKSPHWGRRSFCCEDSTKTLCSLHFLSPFCHSDHQRMKTGQFLTAEGEAGWFWGCGGDAKGTTWAQKALIWCESGRKCVYWIFFRYSFMHLCTQSCECVCVSGFPYVVGTHLPYEDKRQVPLM